MAAVARVRGHAPVAQYERLIGMTVMWAAVVR